MNVKKMVGLSLLSLGTVFAQQMIPNESVEAAAQTAVETPAVPAADASAEASTSTDADATTVTESTGADVAAPAQGAPSSEEQAQEANAAGSETLTAESTESAVPAASESAEAQPASESGVDSAATSVVPAQDVAAAPETQTSEPVAPDTAQTVQSQQTPPAVAPASVPAVVAAGKAEAPHGAPPKFRQKTLFDMIHGSAYNRVENEAAADNVDALLTRRPMKFAGEKFFYVGPSEERGVFSLGSFFGSLDISDSLGRITLGYAMRGFGVGLKAGIGREYDQVIDGRKYVTEAGNEVGLIASLTIAGYALSLNFDWNTYSLEEDICPKHGPSVDDNFHNWIGTLTFTNSPIAKNVVWTVGVVGVRHIQEKEVGEKLIEASMGSSFIIRPIFNIGATGVQNDYARLLIGLNTAFPVTRFDKHHGMAPSGKIESIEATHFEAILTPNLLGEVFLNKFVMLFGEVDYDWLVFGYYSDSEDFDKDEYKLKSHMNRVTADIGIRIQYSNRVACEFAFGDSFFTDSKSIFNGEDSFVSFGGFIYF